MTKNELEKGLRALKAAASTGENGRQAELFQKAQNGTITPDERDELTKSLGGENTLAGRATRGLTGSDTIRKSLDVSDYLREQHAGLVAGLETLANQMEKSDAREQDFRIAMARTVIQMGELMKSMSDEIGSLQQTVASFGAQPARMAKSQMAAASIVQKSFAGSPQQSDELSKSQVLDVMEDLLQKGNAVVAGEDLLKAISKYESTNLISDDMKTAVLSHARGGATRAA